MKTLGQIAYEAAHPAGRWECVGENYKSTIWEVAAKAIATTVRAETIEECAKVCKARSDIARTEGSCMEAWACAAAIRSLALEKP